MPQTLTREDTLSSFAAVIAQYTGRMSQWCHILPSYESAEAAFNALPPDVQARLISRAANHGMDVVHLMQKVPPELWDTPEKLMRFLDMMDISHVLPSSTHPDLQSDPGNWTWELRGLNRSRGAEVMSGGEYSDAVDEAGDVASELTGDSTWWDLNDMFKQFLGSAAALGYSSAWLPKDSWRAMLNRIKRLVHDLRSASTFSERVKIARAFAVDVKDAFLEHKHHMMGAFMLGCLTLAWPPARWFLGMWALTGLFSVAVHVIRKLSIGAQRNSRFMRLLLNGFNKPLAVLEHWILRSRHLIDCIKNGIFYASAAACDFVLKSFKTVAAFVKPHIVAVIDKAKGAFHGFLNWLTGSVQQLQMA